MNKIDFIVIIHRLYYKGTIKKGGLDQILDYLLSKGKRILIFEYPLDYTQNNSLVISLLEQGSKTQLRKDTLPFRISPINWIIEILYSLLFILKYRNATNNIITSDPLTTLPAVILRKLGLFKFHYYHSVDYSTDRFHNKVLNAIYTRLLVFGLKNADLVGVVTRQAIERLKTFRVKDLYFVPNTPDYHSLDSIRNSVDAREKNSMVVTCSEVSHKYLIQDILEIVNEIKKQIPNLKLHILGNFNNTDDYCKNLINYTNANNLQENVIFHGHVPWEENWQIISRCMIGLAFYDGNFSHVIYGDALKIREYCALGLAVVADKHTYTAIEMAEENCGVIVNTVQEAIPEIVRMLTLKEDYLSYSTNSLVWAEKYDKRVIMDKLLESYFK